MPVQEHDREIAVAGEVDARRKSRAVVGVESALASPMVCGLVLVMSSRVRMSEMAEQ